MEKIDNSEMPQIIIDYIDSIIRAMKYRKQVRADVRQELTDHFTDVLSGCQTDEEKQKLAEQLIAEFGDVKLLGKLVRRAKKRCRPLWQKTFVSILKLLGILILLCVLRIGYMAAGRPVISVDYTQWLNNKVRNGRDESLNAWHDYQKAIELIHKDMPPEIKKIDAYPPGQQRTPDDWKAIDDFLKTETKAFEAFRAGAARPYYWNIYQPPKNENGDIASGVVENLMPQMSGYRKIGYRFGYFQIPLEIHQHNIKQAIADSIALYRFGRHISSQGVLIEELVGTAVKGLAMKNIYDLLNQADLSANEFLSLQETVAENYNTYTSSMDWSLEKAFWYDQIQRSFTDDGQGNGRALLRGTLFVADNAEDYIKGFVLGYPNRKEAFKMIDALFNEYEKSRTITPKDAYHNKSPYFEVISDIGFMQKLEAAGVQKTIEIGWRDRTVQAGLLGTLSILRFEKVNGQLPNDLDELLEKGYLKAIPLDPFSNQSLVYRKTGNGFTLYSVGLNFTDDGGVPGTDKNGKPRIWGENGDAVFWPVSGT